MSNYFGRKRRPAEETEVVVIERIETRQLPLVMWSKRACPFCESANIYVTGTREDGAMRYYECRGCRQAFRVKEL